MNRIVARLQQQAEAVMKLQSLKPSEKLKSVPQDKLKSFIEKELKKSITWEDIYDYADNHNMLVADAATLHLDDIIDANNALETIWQSIQEEFDAFKEDTDFIQLDGDVKVLIQDLINDCDLDELFKAAIEEAEEQEEANKEEDPWNQNDFI